MMLAKLPGWPALVLHELTHAAAAAPFASTRIRVFTVSPRTEFAWSPGAPRAAVWFAHLAPTILGVLTAVLTAVVAGPILIAGLPPNPFHALALGLLAVYNWLLYAWPSYTDRHPFSSGGDG